MVGQGRLAERVAQRAVDGVGLLRAEFIIARIGEHPRSFLDSGRADEYVDGLAARIDGPAALLLELVVEQEADDGEVIRGYLYAKSLDFRYPIEDGIPNLLPPEMQDAARERASE